MIDSASRLRMNSSPRWFREHPGVTAILQIAPRSCYGKFPEVYLLVPVWLKWSLEDIFVMEPGGFEETKEVIGGLACPANQYGRVTYEAA